MSAALHFSKGAKKGASLNSSVVKNLSAMQEMCIQSLGWEDPLEKEMPTLCSILAWEIPWTEEPGYSSMGSQEPDMTSWLNHHHHQVS